jgi:hypothetical protein
VFLLPLNVEGPFLEVRDAADRKTTEDDDVGFEPVRSSCCCCC